MQIYRQIIDNFNKAKILVIGDLILDKFIWGEVERISPEAPVPVVVQNRQSFMPGGASNVANNLSSLEAKEVFMVGVIGADSEGAKLKQELARRGVNTSGIFSEHGRPTTLKTRIVAHHQQVVRLDYEKTEPIRKSTVKAIVNFTKRHLKDVDAIIIEDYGKGVICSEVLGPIISLAKREKKIITVDPKEDHFKYYHNVTAITPNLKEACIASGWKIKENSDITKMGKYMMPQFNLSALLITMGERGMRLFERNGKVHHIDTVAQEVFDVSGAGDTVIGAFTLSLAAGADFLAASHISNICAGIVVGKVGVATASREELLTRLREHNG
ncbi:MAG: D-glycero-beta-D-manno-heptose-7-phosphate kinase [Candidatus Omnitrophota bacterium]